MKKIVLALCCACLLWAFAGCAPAPDGASVGGNPKDRPAASEPPGEATAEPASGADENAPDTAPGEGTGMTPERMEEIYSLMIACSYEEYVGMGGREWHALPAAEKTAFIENLLLLADSLGADTSGRDLPAMVDSFDTWHYADEDEAGYGASLWTTGARMLDIPDFSYYQSVYSYKKALEAGEIAPLPDPLIPLADSFEPQRYVDLYLLCLGGDHQIANITREWATKESSFMYSGSIDAFEADGFEGSRSFSYSGSDGVLGRMDIGNSTDALPVLAAIGATSADGTLLHDPIDFYAVSLWEAPQLYILSKDESGTVHIAMLSFNRQSDAYEWDGNLYVTNDLCCFSRDGNFCYVDENGTLQTLP